MSDCDSVATVFWALTMSVNKMEPLNSNTTDNILINKLRRMETGLATTGDPS